MTSCTERYMCFNRHAWDGKSACRCMNRSSHEVYKATIHGVIIGKRITLVRCTLTADGSTMLLSDSSLNDVSVG